MLVAGVDSSTQSTKIVLCRGEDGTVIGSGSAPHPAGTEADPQAWWQALRTAGRGLLDRADAIGVTAQLPALAKAALGRDVDLPRLAAPAEVVGRSPRGAALSAGTGDNMGAALGLGLRDGDVVISIGTSGTAFAVTTAGTADPTGAVAGFADATGRFLPLVATVNAARVLTVAARLLDADPDTLSGLALAARPGAGGLTLLPYLDGERTPNRPDAPGALSGLTTSGVTRENLARAAVEAVLCALADAVDHLIAAGVTPRRMLLIGGGARSAAVRAIAPGILGTEVLVPEAAEYVAIGAARQAAWALAQTSEPPQWPDPKSASYQGKPVPQVRERYAALRDATETWQRPSREGDPHDGRPLRAAPRGPVLVRHLGSRLAGHRRFRQPAAFPGHHSSGPRCGR